MAVLIWISALYTILGTLVEADTIHELKKVNPGENLELWAKTEAGRSVTKWSFVTCEGCRIILSCIFLLPSCDDHVLTINDGYEAKTYCGTSYALRNSRENKVSVSMENAGRQDGAFCRLFVTKPYTNMKYEIRDSSEDGSGVGATKHTSCKCGWTNKIQGRIVGGDEAGVNEYPFAALIMLKSRKFPFCGGSIISTKHVLTAAHCTYPYRGIRLSVILGAHDVSTIREEGFTKIIDVEKTIEHPNYVDRQHHNDIAILKLKNKIEFNAAVGPVCLPNQPNRNLLNEYIKVMGWGLLETNGSASNVLRKVNIKVIDFDICKIMFASVEKNSLYQLCTWAPNKDSCQGDSGGPLVWQDPETKRLTQVALVSFGRDCGSLDPAVNTNVVHYMDWITQIISETAQAEICK